jgi:DNA-binding NtrC family response regulator
VAIKENENRMIRILLIGQDHATAERLGLQCLERGIGVVIAENICEGVRLLATTPVSLIVVDLSRLRLGAHDQAAIFDRAAPGVRVAVTVPAEAPIEARVALELAGFQVVSSPVTPDELLKPLA